MLIRFLVISKKKYVENNQMIFSLRCAEMLRLSRIPVDLSKMLVNGG